MSFNPILAERRFGVGLAPGIAPAADAGQMLALLTGPDAAASAYPIETFDTFRARVNESPIPIVVAHTISQKN